MAREHYHETLERLEIEILGMGELAANAVHQAMEALLRRDAALAEKVIADDDILDDRYIAVDQGTLELLALQTPVAGDLRLISAILHINHHLERVGDQGVNIAKSAQLSMDLPANPVIHRKLEEMGEIAVSMVRTAMDAFHRRELGLCLQLHKMDDPLDRLNRGMHEEVMSLSDDKARLDWGVRMNLVARALERVGDNAVDVGEQVGFLLTGEFREFTDASHDVSIPEN